MADDQITVPSCELDPTQLWAALLIARCYTQTETAKIVSKDLRTVQRWCALPEFRTEVRVQQDDIAESFEESFAQLIENSIRVVDLATMGEISADDERVKLAQDTLSKTAYRVAARRDNDRQPNAGHVDQLAAPTAAQLSAGPSPAA